MLRVLMPRFYVLFGALTAAAVGLMLAAWSRHETAAALGWLLGAVLGVAMLGMPIVARALMRRVRPVSQRGRHAER